MILNDVGPEVAPKGSKRISSYVGQARTGRQLGRGRCSRRAATYGLAWPDCDGRGLARASRGAATREVDGVPRLDDGPDDRRGGARRAGRAAPDLWPVFAALQPIPTLALRGALSDVLSPRRPSTAWRARSPTSCASTVAQRGHPPMLDEPDSVAAIDSFLARLD